MKSSSDLTDFYYKKLHPTLLELEKRRKQLAHRIIVIFILYSVMSLLFITSFENFFLSGDNFIFALFTYIGVGGALYKYLISDYTKSFKNKVILPLIQALSKKLDYFPDNHISSKHFTKSKIFTSHPDLVSGNDLVRGEIDGISLEFSDIHAQKRHKNSKSSDSYSTIFQGLFIVTEFNKHFKGRTVILPDTAQSNFGNLIGNWFQSKNFSRDSLIKMDNVAFEKEFVVYGTDQIEARYILSPSLMDKLLHFKKRSKHPLSISFVGGNVYLAIAYNKDLFEPSVFHSLLKYKIAMEYITTLHLAVGIVEELQLNQKLWSKT